MNSEQAKYLDSRIFDLISVLDCSDELLAFLKQKNHIGRFDIQAITVKRQNGGNTAALSDLFNRLKGRPGSFESLLEASRELCFMGAVEILQGFQPEKASTENTPGPLISEPMPRPMVGALVVGRGNCSITKITTALKKAQTFSLFHDKLGDIARELDVDGEKIRSIKTRLMMTTISLNDGLFEILESWVARTGQNATLDVLISVLDSNGMRECAESLENINEFMGAGSQHDDKLDHTTPAASPSSPSEENGSSPPPKEIHPIERPETTSLQQVVEIDKEILDFVKSKETLEVVIERPEKPMSEEFKDSYNLPTGQKGLALLINIIDFNNDDLLRRRTGAEKDLEYMTELLTQLGYEIYPKSKKLREKASKTKQEVLDQIKEFKKRCEVTEPSSIFVFIGSHGFYPNLIATSDPSQEDINGEEIPVTLELYKDIVSEFFHKNCPVLREKPKIFLIQACQSFLRSESDSVRRDPIVADTIVCSAQVPGGEAVRDIYKGSWFVYCFTYQMMKNVKQKSFQEIIRDTQAMLESIEGGRPGEQEQLLHINSMKMNTLYLPIDP